MGLFMQIALFPGGSINECRMALNKTAQISDMRINPKECQWHLYAKGPAVLMNDGCCGYDPMAEKLSGLVSCPVMLLYVYDDDFWGYHLYKTGSLQDSFASVSDYFGMGNPPGTPGRAEAVSRFFDVPAENIERYLIPLSWSEEPPAQYAYENDSFAIGDSWQISDFMNALGFDYDTLCTVGKPQPGDDMQDVHHILKTARNNGTDSLQNTVFIQNPASKQNNCVYTGRTPDDTPVLPNVLTDYEYIIKRITEAIEKTPDNAVLYLMRAFCREQKGNNFGLSHKPEIDRDLSKALELEPDNIMVLRARFPTTATTKRCLRHITELTRLIELDPDNIDIYQEARAYRYHWIGDDDAAKRDLQDILNRGNLWTVDLVYLCREFNMPGF